MDPPVTCKAGSLAGGWTEKSKPSKMILPNVEFFSHRNDPFTRPPYPPQTTTNSSAPSPAPSILPLPQNFLCHASSPYPHPIQTILLNMRRRETVSGGPGRGSERCGGVHGGGGAKDSNKGGTCREHERFKSNRSI